MNCSYINSKGDLLAMLVRASSLPFTFIRCASKAQAADSGRSMCILSGQATTVRLMCAYPLWHCTTAP